MSIGKASCVYRGNTFYCDYDVIGVGAEREMRVRYNGEELSARTGGRPDEIVAQSLLEELVMLEAISITVITSSVGGNATVRRDDARERRAA